MLQDGEETELLKGGEDLPQALLGNFDGSSHLDRLPPELHAHIQFIIDKTFEGWQEKHRQKLQNVHQEFFQKTFWVLWGIDYQAKHEKIMEEINVRYVPSKKKITRTIASGDWILTPFND